MKKFLPLILFLTAAGLAEAGSVQFSTYYPAPFGMYDRLRLVPRAALAAPPCDPGTLYINNEAGNQLEVCNAAGDAWAPLSGGPWTQVGSDIYATDTTADVGIGTTTPDEELHVGQTLGNVALRLGDFGTDDWDLIRSVGNDSIPSGSFAIKKADASAPGITIDTTGRVGIGTTSPSEKLTVVNNNNEDSGWYAYNNTDGSDFDFNIYRAEGTSAAPLAVTSANNLGGLNFFGYDGTNFEWAVFIQAVVDGTTGADDMPGRLEFRTTPDGSNVPALRMVIKNDGNVGIGTPTPTSRLHVSAVEGDAPPGVFLDDTDITVDGGADGQFALRNKNTGTTPRISISGPGLGNEVLTVDTVNKKVGIGTSSPSEFLHLKNTSPGLRLERTDNANRNMIFFYPAGAVAAGNEVWGMGLPAAANYFTIGYDTDTSPPGTNVLNITNAGSVGIGTTDPGTNRLEVVGGPIKATGGLIIQTCTVAAADCPNPPVDGQMWLCTDC